MIQSLLIKAPHKLDRLCVRLRWFGWWLCGWTSSTDWLLHANLGGDEELIHGHPVHGWEVSGHVLLACVPRGEAEAVFQVHHHLVDHDVILKISFDIFESVDALLAGVPPGSTLHHCLTNVDGSIYDKVVDDGVQHADVVPGQVLWARWVSGGGAVVGHEVVVDVFGSVFHHPSQLMHFTDAFLAGEFGVHRLGPDSSQTGEDYDGDLHCGAGQ